MKSRTDGFLFSSVLMAGLRVAISVAFYSGLGHLSEASRVSFIASGIIGLISFLFLYRTYTLGLAEIDVSDGSDPGRALDTLIVDAADKLSIGMVMLGILTACIEPFTVFAFDQPQTIILLFGFSIFTSFYFLYSRKTPVIAVTKPYPVIESSALKPEFQLTDMDEARLTTYQAARLLMYAATNYKEDDGFSAHLDINRRNASLFHNSKFLEDSSFLRWRLAVLYAGPAAEFALHKIRGLEAVDDLHEAEVIIRHILALAHKSEAFIEPVNQFEAAINIKLMTQLKNKFMQGLSRFMLAHREVLLEIETLIKDKPIITSEDLAPLLQKVNAGGLPKANFDLISTTDSLEYDEIFPVNNKNKRRSKRNRSNITSIKSVCTEKVREV